MSEEKLNCYYSLTNIIWWVLVISDFSMNAASFGFSKKYVLYIAISLHVVVGTQESLRRSHFLSHATIHSHICNTKRLIYVKSYVVPLSICRAWEGNCKQVTVDRVGLLTEGLMGSGNRCVDRWGGQVLGQGGKVREHLVDS